MKPVSTGTKTPAFARVPRGTIRAGLIQGIPGLLGARGVATASIAEAAGLSPRVFEDADVAVPIALVGALVARGAEATKDSHFGLRVGQLATPSSLGVDGFLMQNSPDVGTALYNLERYIQMHDHAGAISVTVEGDGAVLGYELLVPDIPGAGHILAAAMAIGCKLMRALCGDSWAPQAVQFAFRKPTDVAPYRRFFRAPVRFDADACALLFPAATLAQPVVGANATLYRLLAGEIHDLGGAADAPLGERVARLVRRTLASGDVTLEGVAGLLAVHPRTLNRRLKEQGTTFHEVVGGVRCAMAREMLGGTDAHLVDIAASLGYADASAFARAFRRWTGVAPSAWRRRMSAAAG